MSILRPCAFHGHDCHVEDHYADAIHLTSPERCIAEQDITTLMINASYERWEQGEENEFFDRITKVSEELRAIEEDDFDKLTFDVGALSDEEFDAWLEHRDIGDCKFLTGFKDNRLARWCKAKAKGEGDQ